MEYEISFAIISEHVDLLPKRTKMTYLYKVLMKNYYVVDNNIIKKCKEKTSPSFPLQACISKIYNSWRMQFYCAIRLRKVINLEQYSWYSSYDRKTKKYFRCLYESKTNKSSKPTGGQDPAEITRPKNRSP